MNQVIKGRAALYAKSSLALVLLVWAIRNWSKTIHEIIRFYANLPIWDAMEALARYDRFKHFDMTALWMQHNEHRLIGTDLIYAIDMLLFHERQILTTVVSVAAYAAALFIFIAITLYHEKNKWLVGCAALLAAAVAGHKLSVVSLANPFLVCWTQLEFFLAAALAAIAWRTRRNGKSLLFAAIGFAIASTYSDANGMLIWPIIVLAALLLRFSKRGIGLILVCGTCAIAAYFYHYTRLPGPGFMPVLQHPFYAAGFIGSFLSMPFGAADCMTPGRMVFCGWFGIGLVLADIVWVIRRKIFREPPVIVLTGFLILMFLTACLTVMGRMNPADPMFIAAKAGRYITEPTLFWCALILLTSWLVGRHGQSIASFALIALAAISSSFLFNHSEAYYSSWEHYFQQWQWATIAVANGAIGTDVKQVLFIDAGFVSTYEHVLVDNKLAILSDPEPYWIGKPADALFAHGMDGTVHGTVTAIKMRGVDYEVQGWADGATTIVFLDEGGKVIGFGMRPKAGPANVYTTDVPQQFAFTGFIRSEFQGRAFSTWSLDEREKVMSRMGDLHNKVTASVP